MPLYLRQVCLVAQQLSPAVRQLSHVLSLTPCHIDPMVAEFGLENTLLPIGCNFIEVVAPVRAETAAGRFLERRGGDGGYMVICQVASRQQQQQCRTRAARQQVRVAWQMQREGWHLMQLHPGDMGAAFLEVDWHQQADMQGYWGPAGGDGWQDKIDHSIVIDMIGVEIQADDPPALASHWAAVAGAGVAHHDHQSVVALANAIIRFVPLQDQRGPGLSGIDLRVADLPRLLQRARARQIPVADDHVIICGTRFYFNETPKLNHKEIPNAQ